MAVYNSVVTGVILRSQESKNTGAPLSFTPTSKVSNIFKGNSFGVKEKYLGKEGRKDESTFVKQTANFTYGGKGLAGKSGRYAGSKAKAFEPVETGHVTHGI